MSYVKLVSYDIHIEVLIRQSYNRHSSEQLYLISSKLCVVLMQKMLKVLNNLFKK
jgi:hypothetical protein